jgi:hypothetical protein
MGGMDAGNIFSGLTDSLRETDFLGWYRDGRVAGAVLTQHTEGLDAKGLEVVAQRVKGMLGSTLACELADRLQVRVYQLPPAAKAQG